MPAQPNTALERARAAFHRHKKANPTYNVHNIYAHVLVAGVVVGHIVNNGYALWSWSFYPSDPNRRKTVGRTFTDVVPKWCKGHYLGEFVTADEILDGTAPGWHTDRQPQAPSTPDALNATVLDDDTYRRLFDYSLRNNRDRYIRLARRYRRMFPYRKHYPAWFLFAARHKRKCLDRMAGRTWYHSAVIDGRRRFQGNAAILATSAAEAVKLAESAGLNVGYETSVYEIGHINYVNAAHWRVA